MQLKDHPTAHFSKIETDYYNDPRYVLDVESPDGSRSQWYLGMEGREDYLGNVRAPWLGIDGIRPPTIDAEAIIRKIHAQYGGLEKYEKREPEDEKELERLKILLKDYPHVSLKEINENRRRDALIIKGKNGQEDIWYVDYDESINLDNTPCRICKLVNKNNAAMSFVTKDKDGKDILSAIEKLQNIVGNNLASEKADEAGVATFDLPKGKPIGYLAFSGMGMPSDKQGFEGELKLAGAFPVLLARCGYDMVCLDTKKPVEELHEDPAETIKQRIKELHQQGVRDFYLSFTTHGEPSNLAFSWKTEGRDYGQSRYLYKSELKKIITEFADCNFTIDTIACHGGGIIGMMRDFQDVPGAKEGRVAAFVHTKEDSTNKSDYRHAMAALLLDMINHVPGAPRNYGEAHQEADKITKVLEINGNNRDPEFWKSGGEGKPSKRTAENNLQPLNPAMERAFGLYFEGHKPTIEYGDSSTLSPAKVAAMHKLKTPDGNGLA